MLEDACLEPGRLDLERGPGDVDAADACEQRPLHVDRYARQAQAPLLGQHDLVGEPVDSGIGDGGGREPVRGGAVAQISVESLSPAETPPDQGDPAAGSRACRDVVPGSIARDG